jgi:hypothetical protein
MLSWQFICALVFFTLAFAIFLPITRSQEKKLKRGEPVTSLRIWKFRLEREVLQQRTPELHVVIVEVCEEVPLPLPAPEEESHV